MIENILTGNINDIKTEKQWCICYFMPEPFKSNNYELKWGVHKKNDEGLNKSKYETLTILGYGKFEVVVNTTDTTVSGTKSNEFFAFAWLDNYVNNGSATINQTADYGINKKGLLLSNNLKGTATLDNFPNKLKRETDFACSFVRKALFIDTYSIPNPSNSSTILETAEIDLSAYIGKLISIPLTSTFIQANFLVGGTTPLAPYQAFRLRDDDADTCVYYQVKEVCNEQGFIYVNRYGCKEA
jgi:hypothetical protein